MKKLFIIANWKSNKTEPEAIEWLQKVSRPKDDRPLAENEKEIVICPSFTLLSVLNRFIKENKLSFKLGAQDVSPFDKGSYTGEVNGEQVKEYADYVIIGHSERRSNFLENNEMLQKKVEMALKYNLKPIFCVQDEKTSIPKGVEIVAYEPVFAIGSGNPDVPENAQNIAGIIKKENNIPYVLYGGSVDSKNVKGFTKMPDINGVLAGTASLDPIEFGDLIND